MRQACGGICYNRTGEVKFIVGGREVHSPAELIRSVKIEGTIAFHSVCSESATCTESVMHIYKDIIKERRVQCK